MRKIKFILNYKFAFLAAATILGAALVSIFVDEKDFQSDLKKASSGISVSVVEHDDLNLQNYVDNLQEEHARRIVLKTAEQKTFTSENISESRCLVNRASNIAYAGLQVASVESCLSLKTLVLNGLLSKTFFFVFSIIQLFGLIYLITSKSTTERNLLDLINDLESSKNVNNASQDNLLFQKVRELISTREQAKQSAIMTYLKLENEKKISDLSKQVAHDIRGPVTALNFAVSCTKDLDENVHRLIVASTKRISNIANDLLDSNRVKQPPDSFNLSDSLNLLANEFETSTQITLTKESTSNISLKCEKTKFERTLANIIQNSVDASSAKIEVAVETTDKICKIVISDEGIGFDQEILQKVGTQGLSIGKKNGNGIGLSSAYKFMQELGGSLEIANTAVGARVCLNFPSWTN